MAKLNLALLYGGKSGEHEVSLVSAASVLANLDCEKYNIIPIGIDKNGCFYLNDYQTLSGYKESLPVKTEGSVKLPSLLKEGQFAVPVDVVFPVVHGPLYEDGALQGLLELANVAYVGCDVLSSAIGMDKDMARRVGCSDKIRSARYKTLSWHSSENDRKAFCQLVVKDFGWPLFVKPCSLGSSVGIHKAKTMPELEAAISDALQFDETILVEEFIKGREIELAVLENRAPASPPRVSIPGEIRIHHEDGFYSYTAKYLESSKTEAFIPAVLPEQITQDLKEMAGEIFTRLKCKGLARVDFFVNDETGAVYFNEINTLPGFTSISMYPKLWAASGIAYAELLTELVELAMIHHRCRQNQLTSYQ